MPTASGAALPPDVATYLEELTARLRQAAGDNLLGVILYGGLARGRYHPATSDINLVLVLRDTSAAALARIAEPLQDAWRARRVEPLILTPDEIAQLAETFPTKLLDIRRRHIALAGADPFQDLTVSRQHIRLRVHQELQNLLLRMRRRFIAIHDDPVALGAAAEDAVSTLAVNLRALLFLKGIVPDEFQPDLAIFKRAAETFGFDAEALAATKAAHDTPGPARVDAALFARLLETIDRASDAAASMPV